MAEVSIPRTAIDYTAAVDFDVEASIPSITPLATTTVECNTTGGAYISSGRTRNADALGHVRRLPEHDGEPAAGQTVIPGRTRKDGHLDRHRRVRKLRDGNAAGYSGRTTGPPHSRPHCAVPATRDAAYDLQRVDLVVEPPSIVTDACDAFPLLTIPDGVATDIDGDGNTIWYADFGVGDNYVDWQASDAYGNTTETSSWSVLYDPDAPVFVEEDLADITLEATGPNGVDYTPTPPGATDVVDPNPLVVQQGASPGPFPLGKTTISWRAGDLVPNYTVATQDIYVVDTTAPPSDCPSTMTVEATSAAGATVTFTVIANDLVDGRSSQCARPRRDPRSPSGPPTVTCTATDTAGSSPAARSRSSSRTTPIPCSACPPT